MTTTLAPPSTDLAPAQRAVVGETIGLFEPELFVIYQFPLPDGGARFWHAWTAGGAPLGDRADDAALARGLDLADYIDLTYPHIQETEHGRVGIVAHTLRPILAAILAGDRATRRTREAVACLLTNVTGRTWTTADHLAGWFGVGPRQVERSWRA
jgi:hypothetical protein